MTKELTSHENTFQGRVRPLVALDIPHLKPILEHWLKNRETDQPLPDEVQEVRDYMQGSLDDTNYRRYLVAETQDGTIIGMIGYKPPEDKMLAWQTTNMPGRKPAELVNAYVAADDRFSQEQGHGKGVGRALVSALEKQAVAEGFTDIILNSGPRYRETGWGFYDRLPGFQRIDVIKEMYGNGGDAPVWRKVLVNQA